jgi:hypothetical protein
MTTFTYANPSAVLESIDNGADWARAASKVPNIPNLKTCCRWKRSPKVAEFLKTAGSEITVTTRADLYARRYRVTLESSGQTCSYEY